MRPIGIALDHVGCPLDDPTRATLRDRERIVRATGIVIGKSANALGRSADVGEVARLMLYLAGREAGTITGTTIDLTATVC